MGSKHSINVETPVFHPEDWQYLQEEEEPFEEYGLRRTLENIHTGEKIDEYEFMWPNEEQYAYYIKSFNWRHKQSNVVNTKYILEDSKQELCSHYFHARIYIEHIKIRLSEISDIPYPDNLYVLMESLEGYNKIYEHSKYFTVDENQVCVDEQGNIKIWVNGDLSINYPANDGPNDWKQKGQEDMVEDIVAMIGENTDAETEPTPTFREYYEQKKGQKGLRFEEARVLVLNYARSNDTEIPSRFQAIINMGKKSEMDLKSFTQNSQIYNTGAGRPTQNQLTEEDLARSPLPTMNYYPMAANPASLNQIPNIQMDYLPRYVQSPLPHPAQPIQYVATPPYYPINGQMPLNPAQYQQPPVYYIPQYARIEYPLRPVMIPQQFPPIQQLPFPNTFSGMSFNSHAPGNLPLQSNENLSLQHPVHYNELPEEQQITGELNLRENSNVGSGKDKKDSLMNRSGNAEANDKVYEIHYNGETQKHQRNISGHKDIMEVSETDDMVARSLPIKAGYPSHKTQQLATMGQNNRAIYSHIHPKDQKQVNLDGFGLSNPQVALKESGIALTRQKTKPNNPKKIRADVKPIKYFYSMDKQLEIDPEIAADLQKYLS